MMTYVYAFLFCGFVCMIAQLILDNTKLTPGHVTSIFVVVGALLDVAGIYDRIVKPSLIKSKVHLLLKSTELMDLGIPAIILKDIQ